MFDIFDVFEWHSQTESDRLTQPPHRVLEATCDLHHARVRHDSWIATHRRRHKMM